ncbi:MAG TPA: ComEA family DNA-binding protein [Gaiellaceae bacterium]|nr:ComEA family DNA-binding protein [Gaiellaceae bacterium]
MDDVTVFGLTRRQALVLGLVLLAALALAGTRLARSGTAEQQPPVSPLQAVHARPAPAARLVVDVVGAVRRPGLYRLAEGARVADAVRRAGGATRRADLAAVNLAAPLVDGQQVVVPLRASSPPGAASAGSAAPGGSAASATTGVRVSLSSATAEQLDALPGIGPVTAQRIVEWRATHGPFRSVDALDEVPGIGPARIEQLRDLVTP